MKEFTIKVRMPEEWISPFISMLKYMEQLGKLGGSRVVAFYSAGDGSFRPKFQVDVEWVRVEPLKDIDGDRLYGLW